MSQIATNCPASRDPDLRPYWNPLCEEMSKQLWLPTETDLQVPKPSISGSWFSVSLHSASDFKLPETYTPAVPSGNTVVRSKKIRVYPTAEQRKLFASHLFGPSRLAYNSTVAYLKSPDTKANWKAIKKLILDNVPDWARETPYQPKSVAVRDACQAVKNAKRKFKATGQYNDVQFRSKKNLRQNSYIPKDAVTDKGIYHTIFGKLLAVEKIPKAGKDCRLVLQNGRYFLIVPREIECVTSETQVGVIALDPGLRTFLTGFSERGVEEYGKAAMSRIFKLCYALDELIGRTTKASSAKKRRMKKAQLRLRNRISDLLSDLHHKVACSLTKRYRFIVIPEFNYHSMAAKLYSKTVRGLATLAHGRFRQILASHAEKRGAVVCNRSEAYTSKTCSSCGSIQEIGSASKWTCKGCGTRHLRDPNAARGILLRALRDDSLLRNNVTCISGAGC